MSTDWDQKIWDELAPGLTYRGIQQWIHAPSRYLKGEKPIELLRRGEGERVYEAATAWSQGVYL